MSEKPFPGIINVVNEPSNGELPDGITKADIDAMRDLLLQDVKRLKDSDILFYAGEMMTLGELRRRYAAGELNK